MQNFEKFFDTNYVDENQDIKMSYYSPDGKWNLSRCRIEPKLIPEFIYNYIFTKKSSSELCEMYLRYSREINQKNRTYSNSNSMDSNAIINWFKIKRNIVKENVDFSYDEVLEVIENYVDDVFNESTLDRNSEFYSKWKTYYSNEQKVFQYQKDKDFNSIYKIFTEENVKNYKEINFEDLGLMKKELANKKNEVSNVRICDHDLNNEIIGKTGEEIANAYLIDKYDKSNVVWESQSKKYSPYDFRISINGKIIYCEIKSTRSTRMEKFHMSNSEYNFYKEHSNNYWIILVSNVSPSNNSTNLCAQIVKFENPILEITHEFVGFENNTLYINPSKYCWNASYK